MIEILVVDDVGVFRKLLRAVFEHEPDLSVIAEAESGEEALELYHGFRPDVVTLDLFMPGMDGLETLRRLRQLDPQVKVLAVSGAQDAGRRRSVLAAGAMGVVSKPIDPNELLAALRRAANGIAQTELTSGQVDLEASAGDDRRTRVLVVDDDPLYTKILSHALDQAGYHVIGVVEAADEAVALYTELQPELVLLEPRVKSPDGFWALKHILKANAAARVVVVSAWRDTDSMARARDEGACAYLTKPLNYTELLETLTEQLAPRARDTSQTPRAKPKPKPVAPVLEPGAVAPPKVLVVEDEKAMQQILGRVVKLAGGEVVGIAATPQGASKIFAERQPDVVLLDLELSAGNGFQFLSEVRIEHPQTPIIVASGHTRPEVISAAMAFGVMSYVAKPFDVQYLIGVLQAAFAKQAALAMESGRAR